MKNKFKPIKSSSKIGSHTIAYALIILILSISAIVFAISLNRSDVAPEDSSASARNLNTQTFEGVKTVPLYVMSKLRNNPRTNWDINHLLASNDCGNLISKGYKAFGVDGTPNKPIGFIISPNATQQEVSSLGSLITPLYRGIFAEDPQNHIHYFESTEAPKKNPYESSALYEKLLGYVFTYDVSFDFLTPARELCRYEFLPELTVGSGINNDLVHLCSEASRLRKGTKSGINFQENSRGLINGDRVGSIQLRERPLYVLDVGARSQKTECNTTF